MADDRQATHLPGELTGKHEARRAAVEEDGLLRFDLLQGLQRNLLLLVTLHGQPLLDRRLVQLLGRVRRLHAAQGLDQAAALRQFVDIPADRHLRDAIQAGQLLVGTGAHSVNPIHDRHLSFMLVHAPMTLAK